MYDKVTSRACLRNMVTASAQNRTPSGPWAGPADHSENAGAAVYLLTHNLTMPLASTKSAQLLGRHGASWQEGHRYGRGSRWDARAFAERHVGAGAGVPGRVLVLEEGLPSTAPGTPATHELQLRLGVQHLPGEGRSL